MRRNTSSIAARLDSSLDFDRLDRRRAVEFEIEQSPKGPRANRCTPPRAACERPARVTGRSIGPGLIPASGAAPDPVHSGRRHPVRGTATAPFPERTTSSSGPPSSPPTRRAAAASPRSPTTSPRAAGDREIVALLPPERGVALPARGPPPDPPRRARRLRARARALGDCVDVVSIQHEYGIWGGEDGAYVLDFVHALDVPAVATLHTVLRDPTARPARDPARSSSTRAEATVVMSRAAATLLATAYGVDPDRVDVIPHGVPDLPARRVRDDQAGRSAWPVATSS